MPVRKRMKYHVCENEKYEEKPDIPYKHGDCLLSDTLMMSIVSQSSLPARSIHGPLHWGRVLENGLALCGKTGANRKIVSLFAFFHDSRRVNDDCDPGHGLRGAEFAAELKGKLFDLSDDEMALLHYACKHHTYGMTEADVTVQTCWDTDRLDLGRVGITPRIERLCTSAAKEWEMREWAHYRSTHFIVPECMK